MTISTTGVNKNLTIQSVNGNLTAKGKEFWISNLDFQLYGKYPDIFIEQTWVFHEPINLISIRKFDYKSYPVYYDGTSWNALY